MPRALPLLMTLALGAACTIDPGPGPPPQQQVAQGPGILLVDWTIGGAAPTAAACSGVDHLDLELVAGLEDVVIHPIPCALTRLRYDHLPDGPGTLTIHAIDASDCEVASGSADLVIGDTLPAAPSPTVALPIPRPCH